MTIRYLSRSDVAKHLGVTPDTVSSMQLPEPDVIIGTTRGWELSTINEWRDRRPGKGTRSDLNPIEVRWLPLGSGEVVRGRSVSDILASVYEPDEHGHMPSPARRADGYWDLWMPNTFEANASDHVGVIAVVDARTGRDLSVQDLIDRRAT